LENFDFYRAAIAKIELRKHDPRRNFRAGDAEEMPITPGS
jgi:hypothetical protein